MRYVSLAYGTRAEILDMLRNDLNAKRSERRKRETLQAIEDLENNEHSVQVGQTTYMVEESGQSKEMWV